MCWGGLRVGVEVNTIYEFLSSDKVWKQLYVTNWKAALAKAKEHGYAVREVVVYTVKRTYNPNE